MASDDESHTPCSPNYGSLTPVPCPLSSTNPDNESPDTTTGDWDGRLDHYDCQMQPTQYEAVDGGKPYQGRQYHTLDKEPRTIMFHDLSERPCVIKLPVFSTESSCSQEDMYATKFLRRGGIEEEDDKSTSNADGPDLNKTGNGLTPSRQPGVAEVTDMTAEPCMSSDNV